jgi:hypothetical protein
MSAFAIWRRLDTPGHDAALLVRLERGWSLRGTAVFKHREGPASIHYSVEADVAWTTRRGRVEGFLGSRRFAHAIEHEPDGWYLDGTRIGGLEHLQDIDYGFTPATNLLQLRRAAPAPGQAIDLPAAWFNIDAGGLTELPQRYLRRGEASYWYTAPSVPYEGLLEFADSGFIRRYPHLWEMEA